MQDDPSFLTVASAAAVGVPPPDVILYAAQFVVESAGLIDVMPVVKLRATDQLPSVNSAAPKLTAKDSGSCSVISLP